MSSDYVATIYSSHVVNCRRMTDPCKSVASLARGDCLVSRETLKRKGLHIYTKFSFNHTVARNIDHVENAKKNFIL